MWWSDFADAQADLNAVHINIFAGFLTICLIIVFSILNFDGQQIRTFRKQKKSVWPSSTLNDSYLRQYSRSDLLLTSEQQKVIMTISWRKMKKKKIDTYK